MPTGLFTPQHFGRVGSSNRSCEPPERHASAWGFVFHGGSHPGIAFNQHYENDGATIYKHACALGCEGIVSKRLGSPYKSGRSPHWIKVKNPAAPAVKREAEEDWS